MAAARIYSSQVMHQRLFPVRYRFRYRIVSVLFDIEQLGVLDRNHRWFSLNRFNLFSLHTQDHGRRDGSPWRPWIEARLAEHGIYLDGGRIRLLAIPRVLGYAFNPLSVWYCEHRDGSPRAVLLEVRNTFGEHHHYLLHAAGMPIDWPLRATKPKQFHVSPFIDMAPFYDFRLGAPGTSLSITIQEYQGNELMLVATQSGQARDFSDRNLLRTFAAMPWIAAKVMVLIHWQALKIWLRGGRYHPKPKPPTQEIS